MKYDDEWRLMLMGYWSDLDDLIVFFNISEFEKLLLRLEWFLKKIICYSWIFVNLLNWVKCSCLYIMRISFIVWYVYFICNWIILIFWCIKLI